MFSFNYDGETPLHLVAGVYNKLTSLEIIHELMEWGANLTIRTLAGNFSKYILFYFCSTSFQVNKG